MPIELTLLLASIALGIVQLFASVQVAVKERGMQWGFSPRDEIKPPLGVRAGRIERAWRNFLESFPFFAAAVLAAHQLGRHDWLTVLGAHFYFWGRLIYLPLYAMGIPVLRSLTWDVSIIGIILIVAATAWPQLGAMI